MKPSSTKVTTASVEVAPVAVSTNSTSAALLVIGCMSVGAVTNVNEPIAVSTCSSTMPGCDTSMSLSTTVTINVSASAAMLFIGPCGDSLSLSITVEKRVVPEPTKTRPAPPQSRLLGGAACVVRHEFMLVR